MSCGARKMDTMVTRRLSVSDIKRELAVYERKYGMTSSDFQKRYRAGELDGTQDFVRWMGLCRMMAAATGPGKRAASA